MCVAAATEVRPHRSMAILFYGVGRASGPLRYEYVVQATATRGVRGGYSTRLPPHDGSDQSNPRQSSPACRCRIEADPDARDLSYSSQGTESSRARRMQARPRRAVQPQARCSSGSRWDASPFPLPPLFLPSLFLSVSTTAGRSASAPSPPLTTRALKQKHA